MERIMVALDGSDHSDKALDLAGDIAAKSGAELVLLHVISDKPLTDAERHMAEVEYLDEITASLDPTGIDMGGDPQIRAQRMLQHYADVARRFREGMVQRLMSRARTRARERGVRSVQTVLEDGDPASTILRLAKGCTATCCSWAAAAGAMPRGCSWVAFHTKWRTSPSAPAYR
jgi:nucleotide-binding universal stress UspA family protein